MEDLPRLNPEWTAEGLQRGLPVKTYKYDGNAAQRMTGAWPHNRVVRNIADALKPRLVGTAWDV